MRIARFTTLLIGTLALIAGACPPISARDGETKKPALVAGCFQGDRRLLPVLEVAEKDRPLGDWLKSASATLGLPLTATRAVTDDKLTAFLDHRPAGEVLTLVARHLELEWIKGKSGYLLAEPPEAQQRRTRQQQAEWVALQDWMARLSRLCDTPEEQLQARGPEVEAALQDVSLTPERRKELLEERDLLADRFRHSRAVPVAVRLFGALTPAQLEVLRATGFLRLSSKFGSLPPEVVTATHQALGDSSRRDDDETVPQAELSLTLAERPRDSARPNGARQLKLDVELIAVLEDRSTSILNWRPRAPAAELPSEAAGRLDPELQRPLQLNLTPEQPARSVAEAGITAYTLNQWPESIRLASVAEALHRLTGRGVIADSFTRARLNPTLLAKQRTATELLDTVAKELDYTWSQDGNAVLLRSRARAYDRAAEVPERVLQPFRKHALSVPALELNDFAGLATTLTDSQCRGLDDFWGYYLEGTGVAPLWTSGGLYDARHGLRLWASLSPAQRRHALAEILTTDDMNAAQRRFCALAISASGDELSSPNSYKIPPPENLPGRIGGFRVRRRQAEAQAYQDDQGNYTAGIETVGQSRRLGGFGRFGPLPKPLGPKTLLEVFDFLYYVGDGQIRPDVVRSSNLHLVPRWQKP
jgi:hypothetical protein